MFLDQIAFRGLLEKGEKIKYVAHVHPFLVYPKLFKVLLLGILMPALGFYLFPPFYAIWIGWAVIGVLLFVYRILQWYLDAWIVTNNAVIKQEWHSLFDQNTSKIEYGNIEGVSNQIKGFWGTIFRFGNLQIDHMSGNPILLKDVASPRDVEHQILKNQQEFMREQNFEDHGKLKDLLTNLVRRKSV